MESDRPPKGTACCGYASCANQAETWWTFASMGRFPVCGFHAALLRAQELATAT